MCVARDRRPAAQRPGRRPTGRGRRRQALDGPRRRWWRQTGDAGGASGDAGWPAADADGPPADGDSSAADAHRPSADADDSAQHACHAAQHAEHPAASGGDSRWWYGGHGEAPGSKLPAAERGVAPASEPGTTVAPQCGCSPTAFSAITGTRFASWAGFDSSLGPCHAARGGSRTRGDSPVADADAWTSGIWLRTWLRQQARWWVRHKAGSASRTVRPERHRWSTRRAHHETLVSDAESPRPRRWVCRRQSSRAARSG